MGCDFVRPIDREVNPAALLKTDEGYSIASPQEFAVLGACNGANLQAVVPYLFAEKLDPIGRGRPGTQSQRHSGFDQLQSPLRGMQLHIRVRVTLRMYRH